MEYISTTQFDWDNLDIGDCELNHSQAFFESQMERVKSSHSTRPNICKENFEIQCSSPHTGDTPSAYKYAKIYQDKKKQKIANLQKEEERMRVFHSQPAPKFKALKESNNGHQVKSPVITIPVTPRVLKKSVKAKTVQRNKIEDLLIKDKPKKFTAQPAKVLQDQPFQPQKCAHATKVKPFNLNMEKRLQERKRYNEEMRKAQEEKKQKKEQQKKLIEEEIVRDLRKLTTFKAQSNPFKYL